jgi:DNA-binding CsgD family transcriptional regulator
MTPLSQYSRLLLTIYRLAQELPVHEFQDGILGALKQLLPFDSSMWGTATVTSAGIDIHTLHLHNTTQKMIDGYEKVKHLDTGALRLAEQRTATVAFNTDQDIAEPELRKFNHEFGHEHLFITSDINPITQFGQWVSLYRADAGQPCSAEQTELLACVAPHLMQALAINRLVHLDRLTSDKAREKWSVAIADGRGVLYHTDKRFRELVQRVWVFDDDDRLPQSMLDSLMAEDNHLTEGQVIVRRSLERGLLFLKAREREAVDNLSTREFLVGRLLVSGLSQKGVAAKLDRSPETVRSQVKGIFDKLGINNVAMLGQLLVLRE